MSGEQVVPLQGPAEPPGLDAHDRIVLGIEGFVPVEDFDRDGEGLDAFGTPGERLLHHIAEELSRAVGGGKIRAGDDALELGANRLVRGRRLGTAVDAPLHCTHAITRPGNPTLCSEQLRHQRRFRTGDRVSAVQGRVDGRPQPSPSDEAVRAELDASSAARILPPPTALESSSAMWWRRRSPGVPNASRPSPSRSKSSTGTNPSMPRTIRSCASRPGGSAGPWSATTCSPDTPIPSSSTFRRGPTFRRSPQGRRPRPSPRYPSRRISRLPSTPRLPRHPAVRRVDSGLMLRRRSLSRASPLSPGC